MDIPKVGFEKNRDLGIEVLTFKQLIKKLNQTKDHNPFSFHKIQFYLILIVTKNSYRHFVDFKEHKLKEGSALFLAENQVHHFTEGLLKTEGIGIIFNNTYFSKSDFLKGSYNFYRLFNYQIEKPSIHKKEMGKDNLIDIAKNLLNEYSFSKSKVKSEILYSLLKVLLLKAERAKEIQDVSGVNKKWLEVFVTFKRMVENEYFNTRSSKYYASQLFISYKQLNQIVKKLTGKTAKVYIDDYVIMEIKRYLTSSSLSVKEIAFKTGFEEPGNLVNFFKKNTNTTPLKFRQQF